MCERKFYPNIRKQLPARTFIFKLGFYSLFFMIILLNTVTAQLVKTIDISSSYDDNVYHSPEKVDETVTDFTARLIYRPKDSNINLNYNGSYLMYNELHTRNFYMNTLGFNYLKNMDENELYTLYLGADWTMRINGDEYNYYDYNQIYAYTNFSFNSDWIYIRTGYNYRYRKYSNVPDLTNNQHYGFLQMNRSFPTRTTMILEADLGHKTFSGQVIKTIFESGGSGGKGNGRMSESSAITYTSTATSEVPSLTHAILLARIAQSLHTKIGVYIQYRRQISLTDMTSYVNFDNYYQDEELFDDPFSYESEMYSSQFTWILPWQMQFQAGGGTAVKNYISETAFESIDDSTGLAGIREDDVMNFYVNFSKTFFLNKKLINSLQFNLNYSYIRNESNSYWYNFENAVIYSGIQWTF